MIRWQLSKQHSAPQKPSRPKRKCMRAETNRSFSIRRHTNARNHILQIAHDTHTALSWWIGVRMFECISMRMPTGKHVSLSSVGAGCRQVHKHMNNCNRVYSTSNGLTGCECGFRLGYISAFRQSSATGIYSICEKWCMAWYIACTFTCIYVACRTMKPSTYRERASVCVWVKEENVVIQVHWLVHACYDEAN